MSRTRKPLEQAGEAPRTSRQVSTISSHHGKPRKDQKVTGRDRPHRNAEHISKIDKRDRPIRSNPPRRHTRAVYSDDSDDAFDKPPSEVLDAVIAQRRAVSKTIDDNRPQHESKPDFLCTTIDSVFEDRYVSQDPTIDVYSSPSRPRGAIWVKSPERGKTKTSLHTVPPARPQIDAVRSSVVAADIPKGSVPAVNLPQHQTERSKAVSYPDKSTQVLAQAHKPVIDISNIKSSKPLKELSQVLQPQVAIAGPQTINRNNTVNEPIGKTLRVQQTVSTTPTEMADEFDDLLNELADLPSDAFASSPPAAPKPVARNLPATKTPGRVVESAPIPAVGLVDAAGKRQTTLWGATAVPNAAPLTHKPKSALQPRQPAWRPSDKVEPPTHHELDWNAAKTWLYPMNLGSIRDYQYNIVSIGLFHNALVALPTGLGKTFIAATIMLNWFRWTISAQIVFVAPTKPLVAQQIQACSNIVGIPRSQTTMMTGESAGSIRAEEWLTKRVFFMTPQTLDNDLKEGRCDPKRLVLLVIDEAHRATGSYAYVEIVKRISQWNKSFRVLALTATPGDKVEKIQQVIDGLNIARCEIRTENSIDIRGYIHSKETEIKEFTYSEEQNIIMDLLSTILKPLLSKLGTNGTFGMSDPLRITAYGLKQTMDTFMKSEAGRSANQGLKGMMRAISGTLTALATPLVLLKFFSITPFYVAMNVFKDEVESGRGDHGRSKYAKQIVEHPNFTKMMNYMKAWVKNPQFVGHPKLEHLQGVIMKHFIDAQEAPATDNVVSTRVMVFANYRDAAEDIVRVLARDSPLIKPHVFVGQTGTARSEGMNQKKQLDTIKKFKDGTINVLVATSIGEEGLDIGEIDLIICYDASSSPIRMLQRMGRTGRKRRGKIVLLLMEEKEARDFAKAKDNYEAIQGMITSGNTFAYCEDQSPRILPKEITPVVNKCVVEVPPENSQAGLPGPKRTNKRPPKRPPKTFDLPDGVETGFVRASRVNGDAGSHADVEPSLSKRRRGAGNATVAVQERPTETVDWPTLNQVVLNSVQEKELERKFQYVNNGAANHTIMAPQPEKHPDAFANLGKTKYVGHGRSAKRISTMMQNMGTISTARIDQFREALVMSDVQIDEDHGLARSHVPLVLSQDSLVAAEELIPPLRTLGRTMPRPPNTGLEDAFRSTIAADSPETVPAPAMKSRVTVTSKARVPGDETTQASPVRRPSAVTPTTRRVSPHITLSSTDSLRSPDHWTRSAREADCSMSPETPADMRLGSQGIDLGLGDTPGFDESEGEPDSELASFVVNSDAPIEMVSSSLPMADGLSRGRRLGPVNGLSQLFTDETETEPEHKDQEIAGRRKKLARKRSHKAIAITDDEDDDSIESHTASPPAAKRRAKAAQVVFDTDDEDDEELA